MSLRHFFMLSAMALIAAIPTCLHASLVAYDGFDYGDESLAGNNGGTGWSDAWSGSPAGSADAVATGLTYADGGLNLVTGGGKATLPGGHYGAFRTPAVAPSSGTMYISFLADRTETNNYLGFSLFSDDTEKMFLGAGNSEDNWNFQVKATETDYRSTVAADATTALLVTRFDFGETTGTVRLYVNPSLTAEPGEASASATFDAFSWNKVRIQSNAVGNIDEIRIGTTYADVTPTPEPGTCALLGTGLIGLLAYAWRKRK